MSFIPFLRSLAFTITATEYAADPGNTVGPPPMSNVGTDPFNVLAGVGTGYVFPFIVTVSELVPVYLPLWPVALRVNISLTWVGLPMLSGMFTRVERFGVAGMRVSMVPGPK